MGSCSAPAPSTNRIIVFLCALILLVLPASFCAWPGFTAHRSPKAHVQVQPVLHAQASATSVSHSIALICNTTIYPDACIRDLSSYPGSVHASPEGLVAIAFKVALSVVHEAHAFARNCSWERGLPLLEQQALQDCVVLMDSANDQLAAAISNLSTLDTSDLAAKRNALVNLNVWLSAALSFQTACSDGFNQLPISGTCGRAMQKRQEQVSQGIINSLYLLKKFSKHGNRLSAWENSVGLDDRGRPGLRRLLAGVDHYPENDHKRVPGTDRYTVSTHAGFPAWVSPEDRKLLQAPTASVLAHLIVAQDGTGDYQTVTDALNNIPSYRPFRFVVYIKEGIYEEIVNVPKNLQNVTFLASGIRS